MKYYNMYLMYLMYLDVFGSCVVWSQLYCVVQFVGEMGLYPGKRVHFFLLAEFLLNLVNVRHWSLMLHVKWDGQINECAFLFEVVSLGLLSSAQICSDKFGFQS